MGAAKMPPLSQSMTFAMVPLRWTPLFNCGIVGGKVRTFERFRLAYAARIAAHYSRPGARTDGVVDMLALNELLAQQCQCAVPTVSAEHGCRCEGELLDGLVAGYPLGAVNLPMFGTLCHYHSVLAARNLLTPCACNATVGTCRGCTGETIAAMQTSKPGYFFAHHLGCSESSMPRYRGGGRKLPKLP